MSKVTNKIQLIPSPGYKFVHDSCSGDIKWILFQDDDTIIAEEKFQKLLMSSTNMTTCLAKKYSKAEVIRADSRGRSQYEVYMHNLCSISNAGFC